MTDLLKQITDLPAAGTPLLSDLLHVKQGLIDTKMTLEDVLSPHANNTSNPHSVNNTQVGLSNVTDDAQLKISSNLLDLSNVPDAQVNLDVYSIAQSDSKLLAHTSKIDNPHTVTATQIGLGNVNNYPISDSVLLDSSTTYASSKAIFDLANLVNSIEPFEAGMIMMWSGTVATIPTGWALCDGSAGRPDLRERFVRGARSGTENAKGGSASINHSHVGTVAGHALTEAQMPAHHHDSGWGERNESWARYGIYDNSKNNIGSGDTDSDNSKYNTSTEGGGQPHSHGMSIGSANLSTLPPYWNLAFIVKI